MKEGQTILLADDHEDIKKVVREVAAKNKLKLVEASDGQEALDIAPEIEPDLILIHRKVPVLDALSVTVLLKQDPRTKNIPVIVLCHDASMPEREKFQDAGCDDFLLAPFSQDQLKEKLEAWLK